MISALRRPERAPEVVAWLRARRDEELFLSAITIGEIARGVALQERLDTAFARDLSTWLAATLDLFADRLLPFTPEAARLWGRLSAELGHDGADLQIAATAIERGLVVVTGNVRDFAPTGVAVENPFAR